MGKALSSEVKQALQDIYYNERTGRGKAAFALLEKASARIRPAPGFSMNPCGSTGG